jgi:hypothetical protein
MTARPESCNENSECKMTTSNACMSGLVCLIISTGFSVSRISLLHLSVVLMLQESHKLSSLSWFLQTWNSFQLSAGGKSQKLALNSSLNKIKALLISGYYALIETQVKYAAESFGNRIWCSWSRPFPPLTATNWICNYQLPKDIKESIRN